MKLFNKINYPTVYNALTFKLIQFEKINRDEDERILFFAHSFRFVSFGTRPHLGLSYHLPRN